MPISPRVAVAAVAFFLASDAGAGTFYDFSWTDGGSRTASGRLELDSSIGVGDPFDIFDVLSFELELFFEGASIGKDEFPPFDPPFDALEGTREASSLSIIDLNVGTPEIHFGCTAGDCLADNFPDPEATLFFFSSTFSGERVTFPSTQAARDSFVFTEVPEPGAESLLTVALVVIASLRRSTSRQRA